MAEGVPDQQQVTQEAAEERTAAAAEEGPDRDQLTAAAETDSRRIQWRRYSSLSLVWHNCESS